jgi:DNA-binding LytR/AlgR family response regulator
MGKTPINCLIIDDDRLDRLVIEENISTIPSFRLTAAYSNPVESLDLLKTGKTDLLFLDVNMPVLNGVDFLKSLDNPPLCIFITKHPEYAIEAFEAQAIDYLLKPVKPDRFLQAANRAIEYFSIREKALQYSFRFENDFLLVKEGNSSTKVLINDILFIEALANYTRIVTVDRRLITLSNLKQFIQQLPADRFLRVHRSYAVALAKVTTILHNELVIENNRIPMGKLYRQETIRQFQSTTHHLKKNL